MVQPRRSSSSSDLQYLAKGAAVTMPAATNSRPPRASSSSRPPRSGHVAKPPSHPSSNNGRRSQATPPLMNSRRGQSAKESSHFLKGINFDDQTDLLALPSPPSKKKRSRRQSTSTLQKKTTPLQDMTNNDKTLSPLAITKEKQSGGISKSKKRRSLCHVPSPIDNIRNDLIVKEPPTKKGSPESSERFASIEIESQKQSLAMELDLEGESDDENDLNSHSIRRKRSRRRQSILLPSELETDEFSHPVLAVVGKESEDCTATLHMSTSNSLLGSRDTAPTVSAKDCLAEIQKLVRSYCSLPIDSEARIECVDRIRDKTGYSLALPTPSIEVSSMDATEDTESTQQDSFRSQRRDLLARIGPAVERMEQVKRAQAQSVEETTGCTVEKTRSGKYRYRDTSGIKVPTDEYKSRYLVMITTNKLEKTRGYQAIREELESSIQEGDGNKASDNSPNLREREQATIDVDNDEEHKVDRSVETDWKHFEEDDDRNKSDMELVLQEDEETSRYESSPVIPTNQNPATPLTKNSSPRKQPQDNMVTSTEPPVMDEHSTEKGAQLQSTVNYPEQMEEKMLPFPDRDEVSEDPDIARAERNLWHSIDTALDEYSREVLAIQAKRRARVEPLPLS